MTKKDLEKLDDRVLLARIIWGEARGESIEGQIAVGCVIRNRALKPSWWGRGYKEVILKDWQFSCLNPDDPNLFKIFELDESDPIYAQCLWIAGGIYNGAILDNTKGANHYAVDKLIREGKVNWAKQKEPVEKIGNHWFYKL